MNILRAHTIGVAGLPDATYSFSDPASGAPLDFVLVTGPPASGKTRLLETIAAAKEMIAPSGHPPDPAPFIRQGSGGARVILEWAFDDEERAYAGLAPGGFQTETLFGAREPHSTPMGVEMLLLRHGHKDAYPPRSQPGKLEYFHATRQIDWRISAGVKDPALRSLRAARSERKYAFLPTFADCVHAAPDREEFEQLLALFSDTVRVNMAGSAGAPFLSHGEPRRGEQLSWTETHSVLVAATAAALGLDRSVVLVDRPELSGLPEGPERLVFAWRSVGHGSQIIAASGWEPLAAILPPERVIRLSNDGGAT